MQKIKFENEKVYMVELENDKEVYVLGEDLNLDSNNIILTNFFMANTIYCNKKFVTYYLNYKEISVMKFKIIRGTILSKNDILTQNYKMVYDEVVDSIKRYKSKLYDYKRELKNMKFYKIISILTLKQNIKYTSRNLKDLLRIRSDFKLLDSNNTSKRINFLIDMTIRNYASIFTNI